MTDVADIIKRGRELAKVATHGPWKTIGNDVRVYYRDFNHRMAHASNCNNAALITHCVNHFETLARRIEELEAKLDHWHLRDLLK